MDRPAVTHAIDLLRSESLSRLVEREVERMILAGELSPGQRKALGRRTRLVECLGEANAFYLAQLRTDGGAAAREYLAGRGLTGEVAAHFELGWAPDAWDDAAVARLRRQFDGPLRVHRISAEPPADGLGDPDGAVLGRLGAHPTAQYLVRPDGHIGYRCAGTDLTPLQRQLAIWLPGAEARSQTD